MHSQSFSSIVVHLSLNQELHGYIFLTKVSMVATQFPSFAPIGLLYAHVAQIFQNIIYLSFFSSVKRGPLQTQHNRTCSSLLIFSWPNSINPIDAPRGGRQKDE